MARRQLGVERQLQLADNTVIDTVGTQGFGIYAAGLGVALENGGTALAATLRRVSKRRRLSTS